MLHTFCGLQTEKLWNCEVAGAIQQDISEQPPVYGNRYSLTNTNEAGGKQIRTYFSNISADGCECN